MIDLQGKLLTNNPFINVTVLGVFSLFFPMPVYSSQPPTVTSLAAGGGAYVRIPE